MPDFGSIQLPDINPFAAYLDTRKTNVDIETNQQNLADRATLRGLAPGLASNDPNASATALTLQSVGGGNAAAGLQNMHVDQRAAMVHTLGVTGQLSGAILAAPAEQRADMWKRYQPMMVAAGAKDTPVDYPGDDALNAHRTAAVDISKQIEILANVPTTDPSRTPFSLPTGPRVGPGGVMGGGGGYMQQMGASESSGDPGAVNAGGYSGQFQFGAERLSDPGVGVYTPSKGENLKRNEWTGTFNIPGFPDVKTHADFLASPAAQKAVFATHTADIDSAIAQTPGASAFNQNGLRAVAHLGGVAGMQRFVASGGIYDPADANGTHLSDYYNRFSLAGPRALQASFGHPDGPPAAASPAAAPGPGPADEAIARLKAAQQQGPGAGDAIDVSASGGKPAGIVLAPGDSGDPGTLVTSNPDGSLAWPSGMQQPQEPDASAPAESAPAAAPPAAAPPVASAAPGVASAAPPVAASPPIANENGLLSTATGPAPVAQTNTLMPAASAAPPAGSGEMPLYKAGMPLAAPVAGFQYTRRPDGSFGMQRLPGAPPKIKTEVVGGQLINIDENTGQEVGSRISVPDTRRLQHVDDGRNIHVLDGGGREIKTIPKGSYDLQKSDYERDAKELSGIGDAGAAAQSSQIRLTEMRDLAAKLGSGANGGTRSEWQNLAETYLSPELAKRFENSTFGMKGGAAVAQEFAKLTLVSAGQQERGVLGNRGGYQAIQLFKAANPGLELKPEANRKILNMQLISAQADADYARSALAYANAQGDGFRSKGETYLPLSHFDQQWQSQRNPQVYAAAMSALNNEPYEKWSKGLNDTEKASALSVIARADPTASVVGRNGHPLAVSKFAPAGSGAQ